jgi:hypothetical protein
MTLYAFLWWCRLKMTSQRERHRRLRNWMELRSESKEILRWVDSLPAVPNSY